MSDTLNASESAAMLALMTRMAMALGDEAGIGPDGRLYIESSRGEYLSWPVPKEEEHLFAALPRFPNPLLIEPLPSERRVEAINDSYPLPSGWLEVCAARLKELMKAQFTSRHYARLAVDVWRSFVRRHVPDPMEAARLWEPEDLKRCEWMARYAELVRDDVQRRQSDMDDEAPPIIARLLALQPQYRLFTPEQVFEANQRYCAELAKNRPPIPPSSDRLDADDDDLPPPMAG